MENKVEAYILTISTKPGYEMRTNKLGDIMDAITINFGFRANFSSLPLVVLEPRVFGVSVQLDGTHTIEIKKVYEHS